MKPSYQTLKPDDTLKAKNSFFGEIEVGGYLAYAVLGVICFIAWLWLHPSNRARRAEKKAQKGGKK